ncbi:uncharacterized protein C8Q71DRAFT_544908 [Rhodofomes roseus]|uniref:Uncharacterized protein n=1 Tax=Rhodofomes roseus TaxID=34475 RepID=A0ABQ8KKR8_9APHY|nr:uncharacterized protein C8Q71DRAFT_544908 [Rhodofomes roseus]KAH9838742.1 hypothetical protein C8Q71DRAFT_544908 [Rhodofomes roseus]
MSTSPPPATSTYSSLDMALGSKPALRPSTCDNVPNATPHDAMPLPQKTSDTGCLHQKRSIDFDNNEEGDRKRMRLMTDNTDAGGDPPLDAALARTGCIDAECGQEDQCVYEAETDDANASLAEGQSADADADTDSDSDSDSDASSVASTTDEVEPYPVLETAESEEISIYADGHVEGDRAHTLVNCRVRRSSMDLWHERMITIIYARYISRANMPVSFCH